MGQDKAALPWGSSSLLGQVCGVLARAVDGPVVVVRAPGQVLPDLPAEVEVVDDPSPDLGPVQGLARGLLAVRDRAEIAYVAATDLPFLHESVVRRTVAVLRDRPGADVVAPLVDRHPQLLAAAYRTALADEVARALHDGERRLRSVAELLRVDHLAPAVLLADRAVAESDPQLRSFTNLNGPQDYARARAACTG
jgi:molybdopterin-guanine dinucleotide biosynthesis protein A